MKSEVRLSAVQDHRLVLALLIQPLVAALLGFSLFPVVDYTGRYLHGGRPADSLDAAISLGFGTGVAAVFVVAFGAIPVLLWLLKRGPVTRRHVLISGAVLGNVPGALIVVALLASRFSQGTAAELVDSTYGPLGLVRAIAFGSLIGTSSAAVFWGIAGRHIGAQRHRSAG